MDTDILVKKCISKDVQAWNEFISLYRGLIFRSVRSKLNMINAYLAQNEVNDIVQEVFIMLWEKGKLATLRDIKCLKAWLAKVSVNTAVSYCRKVFRETKRTRSLDSTAYAFALDIPCNKHNALKAIEEKEFKGILKKEVYKLPHKQKQALRLNVYGCKKQKDVAEIMDMPAGSVSTLISRSKRQVCEAVANCYN